MSEIHAAVGSYVVDALEGPELQEFESHLVVCETCRREVVEFAETANQLGSLVDTAPRRPCGGSVLSAIKDVRPLPPEVPAELLEQQPTPRRLAVAPTETVATDWHEDTTAEVATPPDELAARRSRGTRRYLALAVAAAMVIALGVGGWVSNLRQEQQTQVAASTRQQQLLAAPDTKMVAKTMPNGAVVKFVVSKQLNQALLLGDMPDPGAGRAYQLWTLHGTSALPDTTFAGGGTQQAWVSGDVNSATGLAVTIEPTGGSPKPTTPVLASVSF